MKWVVVVLVLGAGCTSRNPLFCGDGICTDPDHPFCDIDGTIAGQKQTCIAVSCTPGDFFQCRGSDALVCGAGGNDYDDKTCQNGCDPTSGCVGCVDDSSCANPTPKCDTGTHECRGCTADADCASGVCDTAGGTCIAESTVAYASPSGADTEACTKNDPCSISHAVAITNLNVNTVKLAAGTYAASLTIADKAVQILGAGALLTNATATPLTVNDRAKVKVHDLSISGGAAAPALSCRSTNNVDTPELELVNVSLDASNIGLAALQCELTAYRTRLRYVGSDPTNYVLFVANGATAKIDRSTITGGGGGIDSVGGNVDISNSVIANVGSSEGAFVEGLTGPTSGVIHVSFSTVYNAFVKCPQSTVPTCNGVTPHGVCIDNSILFDQVSGEPADTVAGTGCITTYSLIYPQSTTPMGSNNKIGMTPVLRDPVNGDYHLQPTSPAIDAADPTATNTIDLDGVARPQGARNDMGALEYKP